MSFWQLMMVVEFQMRQNITSKKRQKNNTFFQPFTGKNSLCLLSDYSYWVIKINWALQRQASPSASFMNYYPSFWPSLDVGGWTVALQALHVDENQGKQLASLTSLVVGVTTPPRKCRVLHLHSWPEGTVNTCKINSFRGHRFIDVNITASKNELTSTYKNWRIFVYILSAY